MSVVGSGRRPRQNQRLYVMSTFNYKPSPGNPGLKLIRQGTDAANRYLFNRFVTRMWSGLEENTATLGKRNKPGSDA